MSRYPLGKCAECGKEKRLSNRQRTVCNRCYQKDRVASDPDLAYKAWLSNLRRDFVPNAVVLPFVEAALAKFDGNQMLMCEVVGVTDRRVYDIRKQRRDAEYSTAAKIAMEAGMLAEFEALTMREVGVADWSDLGSFCGDGAPPKHSGCGSWFHAHYGGGLCEECYSREVLGCGPMEPRDVRLAVTR